MQQSLLLPGGRPVNVYIRFGLIYLITILTVLRINCQFNNNNGIPQYTAFQDAFVKELCRERWHRLDWQYILRPCLGRTNFGINNLPSSLSTSSSMSRIAKMDIRNAGDYSSLTIQTLDIFGNIKTIGGDAWRVLIKGPSSLQPIVHDMGNGFYEIPFLIIEPGLYRAEIFLEGTLCSQLVDPPNDWFKKGKFVLSKITYLCFTMHARRELPQRMICGYFLN